MKTVVIDAYEIFRMGVNEFLANSSFDVVANCRNLLEYSQVMAGDSIVDLILTEANIGGLELQRVIETIKKQSGKAKLIVLSEFDDPSLIQEAEELGADGFILKSVSSSELINRLQDVRRFGQTWTRSYVQRRPILAR